jgi:hypothetical protein
VVVTVTLQTVTSSGGVTSSPSGASASADVIAALGSASTVAAALTSSGVQTAGVTVTSAPVATVITTTIYPPPLPPPPALSSKSAAASQTAIIAAAGGGGALVLLAGGLGCYLRRRRRLTNAHHAGADMEAPAYDNKRNAAVKAAEAAAQRRIPTTPVGQRDAVADKVKRMAPLEKGAPPTSRTLPAREKASRRRDVQATVQNTTAAAAAAGAVSKEQLVAFARNNMCVRCGAALAVRRHLDTLYVRCSSSSCRKKIDMHAPC